MSTQEDVRLDSAMMKVVEGCKHADAEESRMRGVDITRYNKAARTLRNRLAAYEALGTPEDLTALVTAGYASYACGRGAISYAELELYGWDADAAHDKAEALRSSK